MLISVSGVGPKAAMSILSLLSPERFALAVTTGDAKALSKAPGVGAKTSARIILELRDKLAKQFDASQAADIYTGTNDSAPSGGTLGEAQNALLVLGYTRAEAIWALQGADASAGLETLIRDALKKLIKN